MARFSLLLLAIAMLAGRPASLRADVRIAETTATKTGSRSAQGVRSTYIKGTRMRIELVQGDQSGVTLFDLSEGTVAVLDSAKKRAEIRDIAARNAKLEKEYPRQLTSTTVTPTGVTRTLAGSSCEEYTFAIRVPMTKDRELAMTLTGSAWIARAAPGAGDYQAFAQAANERQLAIGYTSDNAILLALTRGQTELYRALTAMPGIPYLVDMTIGVDGTGMLAGLLRKNASGARTMTVTDVAAAPLADAMFAIPDDWKREKK